MVYVVFAACHLIVKKYLNDKPQIVVTVRRTLCEQLTIKQNCRRIEDNAIVILNKRMNDSTKLCIQYKRGIK